MTNWPETRRGWRRLKAAWRAMGEQEHRQIYEAWRFYPIAMWRTIGVGFIAGSWATLIVMSILMELTGR